ERCLRQQHMIIIPHHESAGTQQCDRIKIKVGCANYAVIIGEWMTHGSSDCFSLPLKREKGRNLTAVLIDRYLHVFAGGREDARELRMKIGAGQIGICLLQFCPGADEVGTEFAAGDKRDLHGHASATSPTSAAPDQLDLVSPSARRVRSIAS